MYIQEYHTFAHLQEKAFFPALETFLKIHPQSNYFQSLVFLELIEKVHNYEPVLLVALSEGGEVLGTLLATVQSNGRGLMARLSRRLIVWGGPLVKTQIAVWSYEVTTSLLLTIQRYAKGKAIFVEVRNLFATDDIRHLFAKTGFQYKPHLNFLVKTDDQAAVRKRMSKSRWRQIQSSLKTGARIVEAENDQQLIAFYTILQNLYRIKVKKPLPDMALFHQLFHSASAKIFVILYKEEVIGGIACPIHQQKIIYEWYVCGLDGEVKGLYPSVLATWAPIQYALEHEMNHFDFMGAGQPDKDYGVRDFKARFGGEQVAYGRYELILHPTIYKLARLGLQMYQKLR